MYDPLVGTKQIDLNSVGRNKNTNVGRVRSDSDPSGAKIFEKNQRPISQKSIKSGPNPGNLRKIEVNRGR